jgi:hypothetical protein
VSHARLWRERCLSEFRKPNLSPAIRTKIDLTSSTREINWKRFYFQKKVLEQRWCVALSLPPSLSHLSFIVDCGVGWWLARLL